MNMPGCTALQSSIFERLLGTALKRYWRTRSSETLPRATETATVAKQADIAFIQNMVISDEDDDYGNAFGKNNTQSIQQCAATTHSFVDKANMGSLGRVRIGEKAPDFRCEAVVGGAIQEVSLSTFIHPPTSPGTPDPDAPWLILLFIPAAFSFVCPTEVLAFQNCHDEFRDRNCSIAFVSVDTKHSLWHWQNVPRQYGGLGNIDIPLLSDASHKIGRGYGVLVEEEGVNLRGMFIIDGRGLVQQITLNNLTVGRSVLEALRLLEAFQAVAKHGVLCPIDWKSSSHVSDTLKTISNTLVESYEERLAKLQKEFGDVQVTDLDAKHGSNTSMDNVPHAESVDTLGPKINLAPESLDDVNKGSTNSRDPPPSPSRTICIPQVGMTPPLEDSVSSESYSSSRSHPTLPLTAVATPAMTPSCQKAPPLRLHTQERIARHSRGTPFHEDIGKIFSISSPSLFGGTASSEYNRQTDWKPGHTSAHQSKKAHFAPPNRSTHLGSRPNTYESREGSHVILEFADPTASPMVSPNGEQKIFFPSNSRHHVAKPLPVPFSANRSNAPSLSRATSWSGALKREGSSTDTPGPAPTGSNGKQNETGQTRLQATFQAIKNISTGLSSPRFDYGLNKKSDENGERNPGYFEVNTEEGES